MEIGRWAEAGICWDFVPGEAQPGGRLEKPQERPVERVGEGCPKKSPSPDFPKGRA